MNFKRFLQILFSCQLLFLLHGCKESTNQTTEGNTSTVSGSINEEDKKQLAEEEQMAASKQTSPDKRLKVMWRFTEDGSPEYRITVADTELTKVIYSQEFRFEDFNPAVNSNSEAVMIEKVLNDLILVRERALKKEETKDKVEAQNVYKNKYYLIQPDTGTTKELKCEGFKDNKFEIINFSSEGYKCIGKKAETNETFTSELFPLPELPKVEKKKDFANSQSKEFKNLKVELSPFNESIYATPYGERATLVVYEDGKEKFQKHYSGKCSGCQWVNQENWKESFRIEQLLENKILITQMLLEMDDKGNPKSKEPIYNSILYIPSKNKTINLECNENDNEIAFVNKIEDDTYQCKFVNSAKVSITKKLPKI